MKKLQANFINVSINLWLIFLSKSAIAKKLKNSHSLY